MRVILTSHGSTGDIFPIIGLAVALRQAGHHVRFATIPHYQSEIESAGIEFFPLCPNWVQADLSYWMGRLQKIRLPLYQLREIYLGALPHIPEMIERMAGALDDADVLVSSYLFPMNKGIAAKKGVPFATYAFSPHTIPSPDYAPDGFPKSQWLPRPARRLLNRFYWHLGNVAVDSVINRTIAEPLRRTGMPKVKSFFSHPADLVLVGVSPQLFRPPEAMMDARFRFTGYCRWQAPVDPTLESQLRAFHNGEPVPVVTFGSMVYDNALEIMQRFVRAWPRGRKIIVQSGWTQFSIPGGHPHILAVARVSHDQLFQHASVVIHHGGAGTTASVLHAGRPHVVVPHIADQSYFGGEMERLGVGFRIKKRSWPEMLAAAVAKVEATPTYRQNAERVRRLLLEEDGPAHAIEELERFVAEKKRFSSAPLPLTALGKR